MADYLSGILDALAGKKQYYEDTNPFLGFGRGLLGTQMQSSGNPRQDAIAQSIAGLVGGLSAGYGRKQAQDNYRDLTTRFLDAYQQQDPVAAFTAQPELAEFAPMMGLQRQAIAQERENRLAEMQGDVMKDLYKKRAEKEIAMEYLPQELEMRRAGENLENIDPRLDGVPRSLQNKAINELGIEDELEKAYDVIGQAYENTAQIGSASAMVPYSAEKAAFDSSHAAILSALQANWKGPMSDQDMRRIEPLLPKKLDSERNIEIKRQQMMELLRQNAKATPILKSRKRGISAQALDAQAAPTDLAEAARQILRQRGVEGY